MVLFMLTGEAYVAVLAGVAVLLYALKAAEEIVKTVKEGRKTKGFAIHI